MSKIYRPLQEGAYSGPEEMRETTDRTREGRLRLRKRKRKRTRTSRRWRKRKTTGPKTKPKAP